MQTILKSYKYRLYPNKQQKELINKTIGCCRFVYNYYLNKRIELYQMQQQTMGYAACANDLTNLKKQHTWLQEVDSVSLQQTLKDLDQAYQNFFRRVKNGEPQAGFPKFKSKKHPKQTYRTINVNNNIKIDGNKIKLPKLGFVNFVNSRGFDRKIKFVTITRTRANNYYISVLVEEQVQKLPQNNNAIAFDLGLKDYLTTSSGYKVSNPKTMIKYEHKLIKLQRKLAHKKIGSNRHKKFSHKIAKLHESIRNTRTDFLHKLSSQIIKENQLIISEDLNVKGMVRNAKLSKHISDVSWGEFVRMLEYKALWYGRTYYRIDRFYPSSQACSNCGCQNSNIKDLSIREWICTQCNVYHDRDTNAAVNILKQGLKELSAVV